MQAMRHPSPAISARSASTRSGGVMPAPWGGEMGVCAACGGLPPAGPGGRGPWSGLPRVRQSPRPGRGPTAYVRHCMDSGHPLRPGPWRVRRGTRINLRGT